MIASARGEVERLNHSRSIRIRFNLYFCYPPYFLGSLSLFCLTFSILQVLDSCIKNGPSFFHVIAGSRDMASLLGVLAEQGYGMNGRPVVTKTDDVAVMAATMLQELAIMFEAHIDNIIMFTPVYNSLRAKGTVQFPPVDKSKITRITYQIPPPSMIPMMVPPPGMVNSNGMYGQQLPSNHSMSMVYPAATMYPPHHSSSSAQSLPPSHHHNKQPQLSLESQLAIVDSAFDKLRQDLLQVTTVVRNTAIQLVNGTYCTINTNNTANGSVVFTEEFLDHMDMLQQVPPRLATLIEIGVSGILDEIVFEQCLGLNDSVSRLLEIGVPLIEQKISPLINDTNDSLLLLNPENGPAIRKFTTVHDLTKFGVEEKKSSVLPIIAPQSTDVLSVSSSISSGSSSSNVQDLSSLFGTASSIASMAPVPINASTTNSNRTGTVLQPNSSSSSNDNFFDIVPSSSSTSITTDFTNNNGSSFSSSSSLNSTNKTSFAPVTVPHDDFASLAPSTSTLNDTDFGSSSKETQKSSSTTTVSGGTNGTNGTAAMPSTANVLADLDALLQN